MIVDIHGYVICGPEIYARKAYLLGERGWSAGPAGPADEAVVARDVARTLAAMDLVGTDVQFIGPRPYQMMPAMAPIHVTHAWTRYYNDAIAAQCRLSGGRLFGIAALPQAAGEGPEACLEEIDRCVEFGFVGVQLNPDPGEGDGATPGLGERYWDRLYETLVARDLPAIVVSGPVRGAREGYSSHYVNEASVAVLSLLENGRLFEDFPTLRLVIGYGGGSIPFQIGRWRARRWRRPELEDFDVSLRRLYFDTVVHTPEAMAMLLSVYGCDRCLFATQHPGAGTTVDPRTGRLLDDLKPLIEAVAGLSADDRAAIFEGNARKVFTRFDTARPAPTQASR